MDDIIVDWFFWLTVYIHSEP